MKIFNISILIITAIIITASIFTQGNQILNEVFAIPKNASNSTNLSSTDGDGLNMTQTALPKHPPTPHILSVIDGDGLNLTQNPHIVSSHPTVTFYFRTGDPPFWVNQCQIDNNAWKTCTSPFKHTLKSPGDHKFSVKVYLKADPYDSVCHIDRPLPNCLDTFRWTFER
jgi:hypothetical protein